jgi:hypothetical protein
MKQGDCCRKIISCKLLRICALAILIFFFSADLLKAQSVFSFRTQGTKKYFLQAKIIRNLFIIPIYINDEGPFNFVLDSGSGLTVITDSSLRNEFRDINGAHLKIYGAGNNQPIDALVTNHLSFSIGKIQSNNITVAVLSQDPFFLSSYLGIPIDGIIGYDLYSSFVVRQNSQTGGVNFYSPSSFRFKGKGDSLAISIRHLKPFVKCSLQLENEDSVSDADLLIDSGASFPFSLDTSTSDDIHVPEKHMHVQIGVGLSGDVYGEVARIPHIGFGKIIYQDALCMFPDRQDSISKIIDPGKKGSIGSELLKRYIITYDYSRSKIYLKPTDLIVDPFQYNMSGMNVALGGDNLDAFIISSVEQNSPAEEAGLQPNDIILEINLKKTTDMSLDEIDAMLREYDGGTLLLKVVRNHDFFFTVIHLRKLI